MCNPDLSFPSTVLFVGKYMAAGFVWATMVILFSVAVVKIFEWFEK